LIDDFFSFSNFLRRSKESRVIGARKITSGSFTFYHVNALQIKEACNLHKMISGQHVPIVKEGMMVATSMHFLFQNLLFDQMELDLSLAATQGNRTRSNA